MRILLCLISIIRIVNEYLLSMRSLFLSPLFCTSSSPVFRVSLLLLVSWLFVVSKQPRSVSTKQWTMCLPMRFLLCGPLEESLSANWPPCLGVFSLSRCLLPLWLSLCLFNRWVCVCFLDNIMRIISQQLRLVSAWEQKPDHGLKVVSSAVWWQTVFWKE